MSISNAMSISSLILNGSDATMAGQEIARFAFSMRKWQEDVFKIADSTDARRVVNNWLEEFETTFINGEISVNTVSGYGGWAVGRMEAGKSTDIEIFRESYRARVQALSSKDMAQARLLRNRLALDWEDAGIDEFIKSFDAFSKEANALGLSQEEIINRYLDGPDGKYFTNLRDRIGRKWAPNHYANMYGRTRGRELEDEIHQDELLANDIDVIQISDANTETPVCLLYENKFFALTSGAAQRTGLPVLDMRPPFHPNCRHRVLSGDRASMAKALNTNKSMNNRIKKKAPDWTEGQRRSIAKQKKWNEENRSTKAA